MIHGDRSKTRRTRGGCAHDNRHEGKIAGRNPDLTKRYDPFQLAFQRAVPSTRRLDAAFFGFQLRTNASPRLRNIDEKNQSLLRTTRAYHAYINALTPGAVSLLTHRHSMPCAPVPTLHPGSPFPFEHSCLWVIGPGASAPLVVRLTL